VAIAIVTATCATTVPVLDMPNEFKPSWGARGGDDCKKDPGLTSFDFVSSTVVTHAAATIIRRP
jgi:hypothetical protein